MEPPANLDAESLRDEKVKVLRSIRPIHHSAVHAHAFRAQYTRGEIGRHYLGYTLNESAMIWSRMIVPPLPLIVTGPQGE